MLVEVTPLEAGLGRFVVFDKCQFRGCQALVKQKQEGPKHRIMTLAVDARDADCRGNEPVFREGRLCGITTSGGYGHTLGAGLALAYLDIGDTAEGTPLSVEILGEKIPCRVIPDCPYDPENQRQRS